MNGRNKLEISIIFFTGLLSGIFIGCIVSNWPFLKNEFFDIKLIEIIQWITSVGIVILLTYLVTEKINNDFKKKELILEVMSNFQQKITDVFNLGNDYINSPDTNKESQILQYFKNSSSLLSLIINIKSERLIKETKELEGLKWSFWSFKKALTDTHFRSKNKRYTEDEVSAFHKTYDSLTDKIFHCKVSIFS